MDNDNSDDIILKVEVDDEKTCYTLTVYSEQSRKIDENEFIMEIEMWLSEISRATNMRSDPNTSVH